MNDLYRKREFLLGLSLAELAFVFFFLTLIIALVRIAYSEAEVDEERSRVTELQREQQLLQARIDTQERLIKALVGGMPGWSQQRIDEFFTRLIDVSKLEAETVRLKEIEAELNRIKEAFSKAGFEPEGVHDFVKAADENRKIVEFIRAQEKEGDGKFDITKVPNLVAENKLLAQRVQYYQRREGWGPPPCFIDEEDRAEYLYDVDIYNQEIVVRRTWLPKREAEVRAIPGAYVVTQETMTPARFATRFRSVFEWSLKNECRHFVRIYDKTSVNAKQEYKSNLANVEGYFHKFLVQ